MMPRPRFPFTAFRKDESGSGTLTSLFLLITCLLLGGGAVDMANAWRVAEVLQSNAEAAALSAAVRASEPQLGQTPAGVARHIALSGLREAGIESAWHDRSFEMGRIDQASGDFIPLGLSSGVPDAVRVTLNRDAAHGTAEPLLFTRLFGYAPWDIKGRAVAQIRTRPQIECPDPLLSLQTRVDVSSKNVFLGICLMANAGVTYGDAPVWKTSASDFVVNKILKQGLGIRGVNLFGIARPLRAEDLRTLAASATRNLRLSDLDNLSVLSNGSFYIDCDENEVARLGEGFIVENAAIFSECPIRFDAEVRLRAALVVSNLTSLLTDLGSVRVTPDAILTGSPECAPGNGVRVLVFVDLDAMANIPALVSTASPLGQYLDQTVEQTGGALGGVLGAVGGIVNPIVADISEITSNLQLLPICLNARTMLNSDTVVLR